MILTWTSDMVDRNLGPDREPFNRVSRKLGVVEREEEGDAAVLVTEMPLLDGPVDLSLGEL